MLNPIKTTDFDAIKLKLASPEEILGWSNGEIIRPETINYRTQKPEKDGLFCEKIFGPSKDWECYCGKYKKIRYKGIVCDKCGVEVTRCIVRRERMGHITLQAPCAHVWFLRGISSKIGLMLGLSMQALEKVIYFANFIITDVDENLKIATLNQIKNEFKLKKKLIENNFKKEIIETKNKKGKLVHSGRKEEEEVNKMIESEINLLYKGKEKKLEELSEVFIESQKELKELKSLLIIPENIYQNLSLKYGHIFTAGIGAEAIRKLLENIDLEKTIKKLENELIESIKLKKEKINKQLKIFKNLHNNNIRPEWMIMNVIPVIPPDLRPMVALDGGRFAASDLNDLYRRVINRNNRLKQLTKLNAPEVICRNEKRMLQEAVDALLDNSSRHSKTVIASTGQKRTLKSLADSLKGKQGRFRQNLLGKRTDYSGRSVIVVNPKLKIYQCGLPKIMAIELFKPFVISKLIEQEVVHNVKSASKFIDNGHNIVWDILEKIIKEAHVLLNRAPTLHRLGIQAFKPILIEGKAIQIHPLVCSAFNADFDGDQMAVHVPLTREANKEANEIMLSSHNLLKPATGDPVVAPGQDIVWGAFYMTILKENGKDKDQLKSFYSSVDATLAYESKIIKLQEPILVKIKKIGLTKTTVGRVMFNSVIPSKLRYVNNIVEKGILRDLIKECLRFYGEDRTVKFIDELKNKSFEFITKSGLSLGIGDLPKFEKKDILIKETNKKIDKIQEQYNDGLLTKSERINKIIEFWTNTKEKIIDICKNSLLIDNPIRLMVESGARGSWAQLTQILGMKGLVISPSGDIIELPIKGNFKKGFGVLEYFIATHGVRKGLSDIALRTANAGYLTRRLVDVAQDVIVSEEDCKDANGIVITKKESDLLGENFYKRLIGRYLAKDLKDEKGKLLIKKGKLITEDEGDELKDKNIKEAFIRSVMSCKTTRGICKKCYGYDLGYNKPVKLGTAVGIIAAQSIGEPGTQLTMRTFHTGGVAGVEDITQGLPRVEEIFETRSPKRKAIMSEFAGKITIKHAEKTIEDEKGNKILVNNPQVKILNLEYKGQEVDKYYFSEIFNEIKLEGNNIKKLKTKILVKNNEKVSKNTVLYKIGEKEVKSKKSGIVKIESKFIQISTEIDKIIEYILEKGTNILVKDGDIVEKGSQLTEGSLNLHQLFQLRGQLETQKYIIKEIQYVYSSQGQPLNDKHIEIIVKQMFSRFLIIESGDTKLLPGEIIEETILKKINKKASKPAKYERLLLGMTKASLATNSFLSAASFQQTAQILIEASISGKIDYLEGLKENVIIGRLIPAGTGYKKK